MAASGNSRGHVCLRVGETIYRRKSSPWAVAADEAPSPEMQTDAPTTNRLFKSLVFGLGATSDDSFTPAPRTYSRKAARPDGEVELVAEGKERGRQRGLVCLDCDLTLRAVTQTLALFPWLSPSLWPWLARSTEVRNPGTVGGTKSISSPNARQGGGDALASFFLRRGEAKKKRERVLSFFNQSLRPQIRRDYALNLSISLRAGKETN